MTSTNLNIILTNALCCSATKAVALSDKLSKGILCLESEKRELKLLNDRIEILRCYNFSINGSINNTILTIGDKNFILSNISVNGREYTIVINGITYIKIGNGIKEIHDLITEQFITLGYFISLETLTVNDVNYIKYVVSCEVISLTISAPSGVFIPPSYSTTAIINQIGVCGITTELNCLTVDQMDKMTHEIMEYCNICDCQLTQ